MGKTVSFFNNIEISSIVVNFLSTFNKFTQFNFSNKARPLLIDFTVTAQIPSIVCVDTYFLIFNNLIIVCQICSILNFPLKINE
jgi:hypothetical protein